METHTVYNASSYGTWTGVQHVQNWAIYMIYVHVKYNTFQAAQNKDHTWPMESVFHQIKVWRKFLSIHCTFKTIWNCLQQFPSNKGHPLCQRILSLLERCPLLKGSITCIYVTCYQEFVSLYFVDGCPV